ncbi:YraN family protein [Desulfurobacterium indicum]|uniref:YraN family protein n=1 Tax=Desulfurobacterium indicum TaxID=1914305 RepID=UPI001FE92F51|nr:YraN family protein [Desulfurobacterium indicum]
MKTNFKSYCGEIDLIAFDSYTETLIFVEVKLRSKGSLSLPEEAVTAEKIRRIKKAALKFLDTYRSSFRGMRFDVIGIEKDGEKIKVNHIENAF